MSCYFRYMRDVFEEAGVEVTKENKKEIDRIIHEMVDVDYKNCSLAWKEVKEHIKVDEDARILFIERLKEALKVV